MVFGDSHGYYIMACLRKKANDKETIEVTMITTLTRQKKTRNQEQETSPRVETDRQTDRQTDRRAGRQRQTDGHVGGQVETDRQTGGRAGRDRQTNRRAGR